MSAGWLTDKFPEKVNSFEEAPIASDCGVFDAAMLLLSESSRYAG